MLLAVMAETLCFPLICLCVAVESRGDGGASRGDAGAAPGRPQRRLPAATAAAGSAAY